MYTLMFMPGACSLVGMVALEYTKQPYRLWKVDRHFLANNQIVNYNPLRRVPVLLTENGSLYETLAIIEYLSNMHPSPLLIPMTNSWRRGQAWQWLSFFATTYQTAFSPYYVPQRFIEDKNLYEQVKLSAQQQVRYYSEYMDRYLEKCRWIMGEEYSILDVYGYTLSRWAKRFIAYETEFPALWAWFKNVEKIPEVFGAVTYEKGIMQSPLSGGFQGFIEDQLTEKIIFKKDTVEEKA